MKVLTIKSLEALDEDTQTEVHYTFGMEHYTDYVFMDKSNPRYATTISLEDVDNVVETIHLKSVRFPQYTFIIDVLDMERDRIERLQIKNGKLIEHLESGLEWTPKT